MNRRTLLLSLVAGVVVAAAALFIAARPDGLLHVSVLDTGSSPAVLIHTGDGSSVLVDGGSSPTVLLAALGRVLPPATTHLDMVVVTGGEEAAVNGLASLPGHYTVGTVVTSGGLNAGGNDVVAALGNAGANVLEADGGAWTFGGATWRCLGFIALATARQMCALTVDDPTGRLLVLGDAGTADQENLCAVYGSALGVDLVVTPPGARSRPWCLPPPGLWSLRSRSRQAPRQFQHRRDTRSIEPASTATSSTREVRMGSRRARELACDTASMTSAPPLNQLTLIHGEGRFLVDRSVSAWRDRARPPQLDIEVFDGPGRLNEFRQAVAEMPLFDPERALLLRDPPQLTGSAKRGGIDPPDRLVAILGELAPTTVLCLVAHAKVPDRNPVLAAVKSRGGAIVFHPAVKGRDLRTWVEREIGARGLRLGGGSVDHLIRVAGPDLGSIASELDKLVALAGGRPLSIAEVRMAVAGDEAEGLYDTLGELLGPTPAKGAESVDRLISEGRAGQYLLAILAGQIRDLVLTQAYVQRHGSGAGLAAALGKPDWQADRLSRQARSVSPALAAGWLAALHDVDRKLKSGEIAETDGLRLAVLRAAAELTAERGPRRG